MKPNDNYAQPTGIIRMLEKKLLNDSAFKRLMSVDAAEAARLIKAQYLPDLDASNPAVALDNELSNLYNYMYELCPDAIIVDIPRQAYVYHNLRVISKAVLAGVDAEKFLIMPNYPDNPKEPLDISEPQQLDIEIDRKRLAKQLEMSNQTGVEFIIEYYKLCIDFYNVKAFFRARAVKRPMLDMLTEGGDVPTGAYRDLWDKPQSVVKDKLYYKTFGKWVVEGIEKIDSGAKLSEFESVFEGAINNHLSQSRYVGFGPEIIFAYILSKECEIRQLRQVFAAKARDK